MKGKYQRIFKISASILWIIFGVTFIIRFYKTEDRFLLWAGLFIAIAHTISLLLFLFRKPAAENDSSDT
ncbi:MAG: hypothetical protein KF845_00290 [Cyclobacteriaceae bacterium]|nr:hypothetical protein [Cyclobacteriaceae bacterium]